MRRDQIADQDHRLLQAERWSRMGFYMASALDVRSLVLVDERGDRVLG